MNVFKDGEFKINHEKAAHELMITVNKLFPYVSFRKDNNLLDAVKKLMAKNLWDVDRMALKLKKHKDMLEKKASAKQYIFMMEQIYNSGSQTRKIIF